MPMFRISVLTDRIFCSGFVNANFCEPNKMLLRLMSIVPKSGQGETGWQAKADARTARLQGENI